MFSLVKYLWNKITNIGIYPQLTDWNKKRIRLLNGICVIPISMLFIYTLIYTRSDTRPLFWESFQGVFMYAIPVVLNYYRKYNAAPFFFIIYNALLYSFIAIAHGNGYASEYYLVPSGICTLLFFKDSRIIIGLFLFNAACFLLSKYSFSVMQPFLHLPDYINTQYFNYALVFISLLLIVLDFKSENQKQEKLLFLKNKNLDNEREKSDNLLLNILPFETAKELKRTGTARTRYFEMVTVMFTDFKNFTNFSEKLSPQQLVAEINNCFSAFDTIMDRHGIEKIKTIGDSYMCAGGLPQKNKTHAFDVVQAGIEIQQFMATYKKQKQSIGKPYFELRIGINTGPVVAGVVGTKKFAYDIWGDTVNIASRMESSGEVDKVNISGTTYELVKDKFNCISRGKIEAKNKGYIDMYFVERNQH